MTIAEIMWCVSTLLCGFSVIGMIYIYKSMETSLSILSVCLHHIILNKGVVEYGTGIPRMAEDTEMAK